MIRAIDRFSINKVLFYNELKALPLSLIPFYRVEFKKNEAVFLLFSEILVLALMSVQGAMYFVRSTRPK